MGILAGLCAISGAIWGAYLYFTTAAELEVRRTSDLTFTYRRQDRTLSLSVGLGLQNKGRKDEIIGHMQAELSVAGDPLRKITFSDPDIEFSQDGKSLPRAIVIAKESRRDVTCRIAKHLPEDEVALFAQHQTARQLVITIAGEKQSYSTKICFDAGGDVSDLLSSKNKPERSLQLVPTDCP